MSHRTILALVLLTIAPALLASQDRSAVSRNGLDTNPCTVASPCRSFTSAIAVTNAGGEIVALDSGGYGPFSVNKTITISGAPGAHAAISVTSGTGIGISAGASDRVILRNLVLIGSGGSLGISENVADQVTISGCLIRGFSFAGIVITGTATALSVDRTQVLDGANIGIKVEESGTPHKAIVTNSQIQGNNAGVVVHSLGQAVVSDSTITGNVIGVDVDGGPGVAYATVERCTLVHNTTAAVNISSVIAIPTNVNLSQNVISLNGVGVQFSSGAPPLPTVTTFGNNRFYHNFTGDVSGPGMTLISMQ